MAATPDQIPTDLTMEIGDAPSPERFVAAARAFFGYIAEISKMAAKDGEVPHWVVRVREGSDLLALDPDTEFPTEAHRYVFEKAAYGVQALMEKGIEEAEIPEEALKHLSALSELTSGPMERRSSIRLWFQRNPVIVDATIASRIREDDRLGYNDFGTVEGIMDTVQDRNGKLQFRVRDAALGETVMCQISEDQLADAFSTFRKRVEVSGVIHYRKSGTPISIRVERIERLPDDDELPGPEDVRGILRIIA